MELVGSNDEIKTKFGLILNDLENQNLIVKRTDMNSPFGFKGVTASEILCTKSDDLFQNWNPMEDAKSIVKSHFQLGKMISVRDLQNEYTWSDRRLNSSIKYLEINDLLDIKSETAGIHNYHFTAFSFSPNASNLVRSDLK